MDYADIPFQEIVTSDDFEIPPNPFQAYHVLQNLVGPLFRLRITSGATGESSETLWLNDEAESRRILCCTDEWRKGRTTFAPFRSLVPLHLIALEGPQHARMRTAATKALNDLKYDGTVRLICDEVTTRFLESLESPSSWLGELSSSEIVVESLDRRCRAYALDVVSTLLFSECWNAIDDYSERNHKAHALSSVMHVLHDRVTNADDTQWKRNARDGPANAHLNVLEKYVEDQIDTRAGDSRRRRDMLDVFLHDETLSRDEVVNLCLTFLLMGHENVASALSWTLVLLSENPSEQEAVRNDPTHLRECFHESMRLFPSVAALTRQNWRRDDVVCGYTVPRHTEIAINVYSLHRNASSWGDDAKRFVPSRFKRPGCPSVATDGPPSATMFGVGARACVGRPLSYEEADSLVGAIVKRYRLTSLSEKKTTAENMVSLRPGRTKLGLSKL